MKNENQPRTETPEAEIIESRLGWLRRILRSSLALRGVSMLVIVVLGTAAASFLIDRVFRLSVPGRALALLLYAAFLVWVGWRHLLRPLRRALTDGFLADLVEEKFPRLGDVLRSGVEFAREPRGEKPTGTGTDIEGEEDTEIRNLMKQEVVLQAARAIEETDLKHLADVGRVARIFGCSLLLLVAASVLSTFSGKSFGTWFQRTILLSSEEWPYKTKLVVEGFSPASPAVGVPRGDSITLRVQAYGEVPDRVRIRIDYESDSRRSNLAREGESVFVYEHPEVTEPFEFVVDGGDFRSQRYRVFVLERPEIDDFKVRLVYPAYTKKPPVVVQGDVGELAVPQGTTLHIEARATKSLESAWLETLEEEPRIPLKFISGDTRFAGSYEPSRGGLVTVHLGDKEGVPPDRWLRFLVNVVQDKLPTVLARTRGIGSMVTPVATIPLTVRAHDDYGVTALGVDHEVRGEADEVVKGSTAFDPIEETAQVEAEPIWDIAPLNVAPDRRLDMRVYAVDNNGIQGPQKNHAATQSFLVVTAEKLLEEFLRREEEQRRILERSLEEQRGLRDSVYRLIDEAWKEEGPLQENAVKDMVAMARTERQMGRQMAAISQAMEQILAEMHNNRIAEVTETERLAGTIITPLADLSERYLPGAAVRMTILREMKKAEDRVREGLDLAADVERIISVMEQVLLSMKRIEGFTEVINRLRSLMKVHTESAEEALKSYQREVEKIFEDIPLEEGGTESE